MEYTKVRLDFKFAEKGRFYRTILVESQMNLENLGEIFVRVLGGTLEHCFLYRSKGIMYETREWTIDALFYKAEPYEDYCLEDLGETFEFYYDTGDGWEFKCRKYKKRVNLDSDRLVIILEGAGMGIWEDNIYTLYAYLNGEIDKDFDGEEESKGIYKPWNFDIGKYSEFDDPLDIEKLNEEIDYIYEEDTE